MDLVDVQKCRSFEEEIYWKHFGSKYFFRILPDDFHDRLVLPHKFAENMINKLPNKVSLFGPSGASWDVTLSKNNNLAFVGDGWNEFVKAYALKATYLLMFKYKQNKGFEVLIFDPVSLCEKEDGYFVKKPEKPTINSNNHDDQQHKKRSFAQALCEKEDGYFVKKPEKPTINSNNHDDQQHKKRSFAQAFGTGTEVLEDDENNYDDPESEKRLFGRIKRGRCRGCGKPRRISVTHSKAKRVGMPKRNKVGKEKGVLEHRESGLELGHSQEPIEISGKKTGEEHPLVENGESDLELDRSQESSEIRGVNQNGNEGAEELISTESGEGNLETEGDKTNGSEPVKELNNPENGRSILEICTDKTGNIGSRTRSKLKLEGDSAMGLSAKEYASKRRSVTEEDKENAVQRAEQGLTDDSFIAVMRPSALYNSCYLSIPSNWARKHLPCQSRKVVLRAGEETWPVSFYWHKQRGAWLGGARWREFVSDNHLEEFDVCLVKLASQKGDAVIVFDFDIFRVFPETVSPTLAGSLLNSH